MRNFDSLTIRACKDGRKMIKTTEGKWIVYAVYVAQHHPEICGEWFEGCEVHHIDLDRTNDKPENLICLSKEEHHKLHAELWRKRGTKVTAYKNGELFGTFDTITECSKKTGVYPTYIHQYLKGYKIKTTKFGQSVWHFENAS